MMDVPWYRLAVTLVAGLVFTVAPAPGTADEPASDIDELSSEKRDELKSHVDEGQAAYDNGDFEQSLEEFKRAREILNHPDFVYRIALAHERLGNVRKALEAYREFLEMAPDAEERGKIERTIEELEERLESSQPTLEITTKPAGAEVFLDGESESRGITNLNLEVEAGEHELRLHRNGYRVAERTVDISRGETVSMQIDLEKKERQESVDEISSDERSQTDASGPRIGPMITLGAGGLLAVGSVVSYTRFAHFRGEVRAHKECVPDCVEPDGFDEDADRQKSWERATWTLGSLAVATAAAGTLWMVLGGDKTPDGAHRSTARPIVAPMLGPDRIGLEIQFRLSGGPR